VCDPEVCSQEIVCVKGSAAPCNEIYVQDIVQININNAQA